MDSQPSLDEINELRKAIIQRISAENASVHSKDLQRIKDDDDWLRRFLMHTDLKQNEALQMMSNVLKWRNEYGTNDISEQNVKMDILILGGFFPRGRDIDGKLLFIFKCKKYVKNQHDTDDIKRCVIYWMERLERQSKGEPITMFFDMDGTGLSNMDLEFVKYIIGLFKDYYPYFLNYVLIFEMPWILNAAFKVIKTWLPEKAVKKIKFISKKDLKEWVPLDQALVCWGGEDDYTFSFLPEASSKEEVITQNNNNNRKVRFDDGTQMSDVGSTVTTSGEDGSLLSVNPEGLVKFTKDSDDEFISHLVFQNIASSPISFKVKTTAPEKFRVRPGYGCLAPGCKAIITVCLLPAYKASSIGKDKFLILSTMVDNSDLSSDELINLWKNASTKNEHQIHLRCAPLNEVVKNGSVMHAPPEVEPSLSKLTSTLQDIRKNQKELHSSIINILYIQLSLIVLVIAILLYVMFSQNNQNLTFVKNEPTP